LHQFLLINDILTVFKPKRYPMSTGKSQIEQILKSHA